MGFLTGQILMESHLWRLTLCICKMEASLNTIEQMMILTKNKELVSIIALMMVIKMKIISLMTMITMTIVEVTMMGCKF